MTPSERYTLFVECIKAIGLSQADLTRLHNGGQIPTRAARNAISDKLAGREGKAITKADLAWAQALLTLHRVGIDPAALRFDARGQILAPSPIAPQEG